MKIAFPALPSNWTEKAEHQATFSKPQKTSVETVGMSYEIYAQRKRRGRTLSEDEKERAELSDNDESMNKSAGDVMFDEHFEFPKDLSRPNPALWKDQDHYEIMGLHKLRTRATREDIKRAYKIMVMKHHPDKKPKTKDGKDDDAYFKCLKIASEWLGDPSKRRSFDSADPEFDDDYPTKEVDEAEFFKVWGPVFERNERWSEEQPVPKLGDVYSERAHVESFYDFWYKIRNWREFSYLDKEDTSTAGNRENKRWLDKKNKKERETRKKEDQARFMDMIDGAFKSDPRIKLFKQAQKKEREEKKALRQKQLMMEKQAKFMTPEQKKLAQLKAKQEKEKKQAQRAKYIEEVIGNCPDDIKEQGKAHLNGLEYDVIEKLCADFEKATFVEAIRKEIKELALVKEAEDKKIAQAKAKEQEVARLAEERRLKGYPWSDKELELLVKAVKIFPAGTRSRWAVMHSYITDRAEGSTLLEKDIIDKVKKQTSGGKTDDFSQFQKNTKSLECKPQGGVISTNDASSAADSWTAEQQKQFERALKKYKAIAPKEGKFDKVAKDVKGKNKKQCVERYKYLATQIKSNKA